MANSKDISVKEVQIGFEDLMLRSPLKFGGKVLTALTLLNVEVVVKDRLGNRANGIGSMILGNSWSFPSKVHGYDETLGAMKVLAECIQTTLNSCTLAGHPIELMTDLEPDFLAASENVTRELGLSEVIPKLCTLVVASPFDAALHDAYGRVHNLNVYNAYGSDFMNRDLAFYLTPEFAGEYLEQYTLRTPKPRMPLYHLVGAMDPLTDADVKERIEDGLPNTLAEWIQKDGLTHLKIKLDGNNLDWDVERTLGIEQVSAEVQMQRQIGQWFYSVDFNERCPDVQYLLDYLERIREKSRSCFDRIQYIEQPTSRYLKDHRDVRMHEVAKVKPIVIDEALVDFEHLLLSMELGYSGVALKTCKGQSQALLMAAAALKYNLFLCVQDLTLVGASFLHSAGLCARIPNVAAIEGNGRQYCPNANKVWEQRWDSIFRVTDGTLGTSCLTLPGLGHTE
ncbi:MAG TPA: enolase C-terminal domain-like protein [bacterium]|nr:enolase C-terminal domain-like protein [bacterium]